MRIATAIVAALLVVASVARADSVFLNKGKCIKGTIVAEHPDRIEIRLPSGEVVKVPRSEIAMITKGTSALEEFKARMAALEKDDCEGHLELAAWCAKKKLRRQQIQALKRVVAVDPDCAQARRALHEIWDGKRWVKDKKKGNPGKVQLGPVVTCESLRLKLTPPVGWSREEVGDGHVRFQGPARYRRPVLLELTTETPDRSLEEGWSKPAPASFAGLKGTWIERTRKDDGCSIRAREYALDGTGVRLGVRLEALAVEIDDWMPHLKGVLEKAESVVRKLDYRNPQLGIGFCTPAGWTLGGPEGIEIGIDAPGAQLIHQGADALSIGAILYLQAQPSDLVEYADETLTLDELARESVTQLGQLGTVQKTTDSRLGGVRAKIIHLDLLLEGTPMRGLFLTTCHAGRVHVLFLLTHERSQERFLPAYDKVRTTFTYGVK